MTNKLHKIILANLPFQITKEMTVADIGCGNEKILPQAKGYDTAHRWCATRIRDLSDIKEQFDVVFCIQVVQYTSTGQVRRLLMGLERLVKPGGRLVITLTNNSTLFGLLQYKFMSKVPNNGATMWDVMKVFPDMEFKALVHQTYVLGTWRKKEVTIDRKIVMDAYGYPFPKG